MSRLKRRERRESKRVQEFSIVTKHRQQIRMQQEVRTREEKERETLDVGGGLVGATASIQNQPTNEGGRGI
ncbi:unnamed protein product [Pleuronectes platessa]|uniref:Uncharacterized protein n=1 Tax=Pleuronectes platessa TaxID=8262 RepID=A0A9N7UA51_PLEPL|nr:unnamed protein product [Pleuronectes platessa]